jgi:hypothetical protein
MEPTRISHRRKFELALKAGCDVRTIGKVLAGAPCTTLARGRALLALQEAGLMPKPADPAGAPGGQP